MLRVPLGLGTRIHPHYGPCKHLKDGGTWDTSEVKGRQEEPMASTHTSSQLLTDAFWP